jgi:mannose-6-phosphate isomerase
MELCCVVQKYAWGKVGKSSLVAQLSQGNSAAPVVEVDPYAELWMGTHPSGPSLIKTSNEPLLNHLLNNVDSLGDAEKKSFGTDLPFLFKALSVAKALSIQAHPNKVTPLKHLFNPYNTDRSFDAFKIRNMLRSCLPLDQISTRIPTTSLKW